MKTAAPRRGFFFDELVRRVFQRPSLVLLLLVTAACSETRAPRSAQATDDLGRAVTVPAHVERVVTLAPNLTEIVYAVGAEKKIVGTDEFSDYPPAARQHPKVGGMQPNVEKIVALQPDLVFASTEGNHPNLARVLEAAGIPLYVVRTDRLADVPAAMTRLGALLEATRTAEAVAALRGGIERERRVRRNAPRLLFAVWTDPLYVAGRKTFTDDLFKLVGAQNAVQLDGWPQYSLERLVESPPDVILYPRASVSNAQIDALRQRLPMLRGRIVPVRDDVFQRPGPRLAEAARALNEILDSTAPVSDARAAE